jgi:hypothetical protein
VSRTKAFIVDVLMRLPMWIAKPIGSFVHIVWPGFRSA